MWVRAAGADTVRFREECNVDPVCQTGHVRRILGVPRIVFNADVAFP